MANLRATSAFASGLRSNGLLPGLDLLNLCFGDTLASCLVPLIGGTQTNHSLVAGDYSAANGITCNGSTKYVQTGVTPTTLVGGIGLRLSAVGTLGASQTAMGARDGTPTQGFRIYSSTTNTGGQWGGGNVGGQLVTVASVMSAANYDVERVGATDLRLFKDGAQLGTTQTTSVTPATPGVEMFVGCYDGNGTAGTYMPTGTKIAAYWHNVVGWVPSQVAAFNTLFDAWRLAVSRS